MRPARLAASAAPLFLCLLGNALADAPPDADALARLQQQVQELTRRVAQQQQEIVDLRARMPGQPEQQAAAQPGPPPAPAPQALAAAPAQAAPPLATSRQDAASEAAQSPAEVAAQGHAPQFQHRLTLTAGWNDTYYDRRQLALSGFLALDAIFLGNISVAQTKAHVETFDLAVQYGLSDDLALDFDLPYVLRNSRFLSAGQNASTSAISEASVTNADVGDISFGADYRLIREHGDIPDVVASLKVTAPTGTSPFGIAVVQPDPQNTNLQVPQRLPTGNGVWTVNPSVSVLKSRDPVVLFGNIGYVYNLARDVAVINPASIDGPGRVKLGDGIQLGGGFAVVLNDRASISTSLAALFSRATEVRLPGQGWQAVHGSASANVSLGFGLNYALSRHLTLSATLQAGLTPDAPNYALSIRFPYVF